MTKIAFVGDVHIKENTPRSRKDCYYESILNKLEQILNDNDYIIFLGDLFDKPVISTFLLNKLIDLFKKYDKNVHTIIGNHDIFNMNFDTLPKTSLGILINTDIVKLIDDPLIIVSPNSDIKSVCIQNIPMIKGFKLPTVRDNYINFFVGHLFYESALDLNYSITRDMLENTKVDFILLGHDHVRHPQTQVKNTEIRRPGSIGRNTAEEHNLYRTPGYYQFEIDANGAGFTYTTLNTNIDIYFDEVYEINNNKKVNLSFINSIEDVLKQFKKSNGCKYSVKNSLNALKISNVCYNYIKTCYEKNDLRFF